MFLHVWSSTENVPIPSVRRVVSRHCSSFRKRRVSDALLSFGDASAQRLPVSDMLLVHKILQQPRLSVRPQQIYPVRNDHVTRWEGVPLTGGGESGENDDGPTIVTDTIKEEDETEADELPYHKKFIKYVKMLLPHVILISMLLSYLSAGALILGYLEQTNEVRVRSDRLHKLKFLYQEVIQHTWTLYSQHSTSERLNETEWNTSMLNDLMKVSALHEEDLAAVHKPTILGQHSLSTKWTFPTSLLYVLTVLTTCGYNEVDVMTDKGKIFSVIFALVGIPLMFITAADLGKFLSETLLRLMTASEKCWRNFLWCCCKRRPKDGKSSVPGGEPRDSLDEMVDGDEMDTTSLFFPIGAYFLLISLYCSLGAAMFQHYQHDWSFIHAFHFGFNLIVTVGLGDLVVDDPLYLCLIVAYVIIGLSVVTMCVDLASTHLKAYFTRIHYFGRARRFLGVSEDIREMMELIARMRKKKGGKVTWQDIQQYMDTKNDNRLRPFCPKDFHKWRYVDETSSAVSTMRHNSQSSDLFYDPLTGHTLRRQSYMKHNNNNTVEEEIPFI